MCDRGKGVENSGAFFSLDDCSESILFLEAVLRPKPKPMSPSYLIYMCIYPPRTPSEYSARRNKPHPSTIPSHAHAHAHAQTHSRKRNKSKWKEKKITTPCRWGNRPQRRATTRSIRHLTPPIHLCTWPMCLLACLLHHHSTRSRRSADRPRSCTSSSWMLDMRCASSRSLCSASSSSAP
jgi:hypothetical protein